MSSPVRLSVQKLYLAYDEASKKHFKLLPRFDVSREFKFGELGG